MSNDISEKCKEQLRDIDKQLTHIFSEPELVAQRLTSARSHLLDQIIGAHDDVDDQCREVLRGIEPEIQNLRTIKRDVSGDVMPQEHLVERLWYLRAAFQYIVRNRLD